VEPSGLTYNYFGCAIGKGKQPAKVEIEKLKLGELTCREVFLFFFLVSCLALSWVTRKGRVSMRGRGSGMHKWCLGQSPGLGWLEAD
jgi:hypothetical protein